ncbi:hypothetical protein G3578_09760 [Brevibacillus sp. SYP-B805]|uniref:hypothetical protein n=1 Tax=Brevibacillus sp. SYP-B805 TaxID=1578199 RepID=UPI0013E9C0CE|nr:hypothetical protein [Brevibacillus sp. SYP-B805]NGQ95438.1 hypothetical protein [Brevibacillus sp. SYP-B805]
MRNRLNVGKTVYKRYKVRVESDKRKSQALIAEERAADLVLHSSYVTTPIYESGVVGKGEHARLIKLFTANLAAQEYAHAIGKLYEFDLRNAHNRAAAVVEYALRNFPGVRALLQQKGKKDVDLYFAFKDASLTESALCAFIAGIDMRDDTRIATEVALVQRFSRENKRFDATMKALGVDVRDPLAIKQAGEFVNFRDYIIEAWRDVPYFQRREPFITELIDQADRVSYDVSDGLIKPSLREKHKDDNALELKRAATREFSEGFIAHLINTLGLDFHKIAEKVERYEALH